MVTEIYNIRKQENYTSNYKDYCIDYIEYKSIEDKIQNVELQLLNLLGDRTKRRSFILRFRYEYRKLKDEKCTIA